MFRRIRWWWWVGLVVPVFYMGLVGLTMSRIALRRWIFANAPVSMLATMLPFALVLTWYIVIAPHFEAGRRTFSDRRPARWRSGFCQIFAYLPTVIFAALLLQYGVVRLAGIEHYGWYDHGYGWWIVGALIISIVYGRIMALHLARRVRAAAAARGVCFRCNYELQNLTSDRCPECGEPLAS